MNAAAVLDCLQALGVTIEVQADKLRFWPRSAVGPQVLEEMRVHKAELVALLTVPVVVDAHHDDGAGTRHVHHLHLAEHEGDGALPRGHRLIGVEYPPRPVETPDLCIIADPVTMCSCGGARLLPELQSITGGRCWKCDTEGPTR